MPTDQNRILEGYTATKKSEAAERARRDERRQDRGERAYERGAKFAEVMLAASIGALAALGVWASGDDLAAIVAGASVSLCLAAMIAAVARAIYALGPVFDDTGGGFWWHMAGYMLSGLSLWMFVQAVWNGADLFARLAAATP